MSSNKNTTCKNDVKSLSVDSNIKNKMNNYSTSLCLVCFLWKLIITIQTRKYMVYETVRAHENLSWYTSVSRYRGRKSARTL